MALTQGAVQPQDIFTGVRTALDLDLCMYVCMYVCKCLGGYFKKETEKEKRSWVKNDGLCMVHADAQDLQKPEQLDGDHNRGLLGSFEQVLHQGTFMYRT